MLKTTAAFLAAASLGGGALVDAQINPYTDKADRYEAAAESVTPGAGEVKVEILKDRPEVRLKKWDGEADLGISYEKVEARGSRTLFTDRVEWKDGAEEVHAYPLEAKEGMEDGGFEIEVVLNEEPNTNVFEFTLDGAENLDFSYQPELTKEEIEQGISRPEDIIGSYAVYHNAKVNHLDGSTNYATGKVFHIYRPKAIDADGNAIWAELRYSDNILSVAVPQKFLDTATYPVKVDPTFGYTSQGATEACGDGPGGAMRGDVSGTVTAINAYVRGGATFTDDGFLLYLYNDTAGTPVIVTPQYTSSFQALSASTYSLLGVSGLSQAITNPKWVGARMFEGTGSGYPCLAFDTGGNTTNYGAFINEISIPTLDSNRYSVYATYSEPAASSQGGLQIFE